MSSALFPWQAGSWQQWQQQANRLAHAYLLTGPSGSGMEQFALKMAEGLLCQQASTEPACGTCPQCHQFRQSTHPDLFQVEVLEEKKEISIDQIRALSEKIYTTSHQGGFKVALIEQVEKLNTSAFNALLKTLEEPPEKTVLILTAHQTARLPATIVSRCRQIQVPLPSLTDAMTWLMTKVTADEALIKRALKVNWGAPLKAKAWIESKRFEEEAAWQADIKQLQNGQISVSQAVEKWQKYADPESVLDYFYLRSVSAIRAALYQQKLPFNPNWLVFQKAVLLARDYWQQNINKDLLLESLCLEWLACEQPNAQLSEAFQSQQIRGAQL